jgi:hypothetical protein
MKIYMNALKFNVSKNIPSSHNKNPPKFSYDTHKIPNFLMSTLMFIYVIMSHEYIISKHLCLFLARGCGVFFRVLGKSFPQRLLWLLRLGRRLGRVEFEKLCRS